MAGIPVNKVRIKLNGILVDTTLYNYETNNKEEAYYMAAILNSSFIDNIIKSMQARGLFGPRHIHKKPFEMHIPKFNSGNPIHERLSKLGLECRKDVEKILPKLSKRYKSIGFIRKKVKETLKEKIDEIDKQVLQLFESK